MELRLTRKEQKANTRAGLLTVATELFVKKGIQATNTADIAKALGVSHATVFIHFQTRENLVVAVIEKFGAQLNAEFEEKLSSTPDLEQVLKSHLAVLARFEAFYFRLISEIHLLPAGIRSLLFMLNAAVSCRIEAAMRGGNKGNLEREMVFNTWIALIHHYVTNRDLFAPGKSVLKEKGPELIKFFNKLISNRKRS
jgi:AcrR family transcriptional regulator